MGLICCRVRVVVRVKEAIIRTFDWHLEEPSEELEKLYSRDKD
jgi:hypothetical protein